MKIASLFVSLGLDGAGDVSKGLNKISGSLKELFSMSIQTKLTLAGIASGLTAAAFSAGKTGKDLLQFKYGFDLSTKEMQKFSWATRQFGVESSDAIGYIEGIQDALANARQGGGMAQTFSALHIDPSQVKDAFEVAKILGERAKTANVDYFRTMGDLMSPSMVAANRRMSEKGGVEAWMNKAPASMVRSDAQIENQAKIALAFENFSQNLKTTMDNFIVKNEPLITKLIKQIEYLLEGLLSLVSKIEFLFPDKNKSEKERLTEIVKDSSKAIGGNLNPMVFGGKFVTKLFDAIGLGETAKIYGPTMEQAGFKQKDILPKAPDNSPVEVEFQEKGKSTIVNIENLSVVSNDASHLINGLQNYNTILQFDRGVT